MRAGQQGVKAKWVRIELRKVEVLPGGGQAGTFFDYVGQSPINLWTGPDGEYGILRPVRPTLILFVSCLSPVSSTTLQQDFPFYIRIPESLPPTIALEKGGRSRLQISPHSVAYCNHSRYQVRVDCHGLHQGEKVCNFSFTSQSHAHPGFPEGSFDVTSPPSFRPPLKSSSTSTSFTRRGPSIPNQRLVMSFKMVLLLSFSVAKPAMVQAIG